MPWRIGLSMRRHYESAVTFGSGLAMMSRIIGRCLANKQPKGFLFTRIWRSRPFWRFGWCFISCFARLRSWSARSSSWWDWIYRFPIIAPFLKEGAALNVCAEHPLPRPAWILWSTAPGCRAWTKEHRPFVRIWWGKIHTVDRRRWHIER